MKKVLVLGAGLVTRPLVRYLLDNGFYVTVASRTVSKAEKLISSHPNGKALALLVDNRAELERLIGEHDLAVLVVGKTEHEVADFVSQKLATIEGVQGTATHFILRRYKEDGEILEEKAEIKRQRVVL